MGASTTEDRFRSSFLSPTEAADPLRTRSVAKAKRGTWQLTEQQNTQAVGIVEVLLSVEVRVVVRPSFCGRLKV